MRIIDIMCAHACFEKWWFSNWAHARIYTVASFSQNLGPPGWSAASASTAIAIAPVPDAMAASGDLPGEEHVDITSLLQRAEELFGMMANEGAVSSEPAGLVMAIVHIDLEVT